MATPPRIAFRVHSGSAQLTVHGQDRCLVRDDLGLFGVFDGVGEFPQSGGAATCAALACAAAVQPPLGGADEAAGSVTELVAGLRAAHSAIVAHRWGATTAVVARVRPDGVAFASVGDSRLYVQAGADRLRQWTTDEGVANRVDNWLGEGLPLPTARVGQKGTIPITLPLTLCLVTDGVTGDVAPDRLTPADLERALAGRSAQHAADRLIQVARKHDDRTAVVVRLTAIV